MAIEFNRDIEEIKTALDVFIELEMVELINDKLYRVKNFAKHQNIKVKEKNEAENKQDDISNEKSKEKGINKVLVEGLENLVNEENSDIQHNNSPVVLELRKTQKTNKKNKKGGKRKLRSDVIENNEDGFVENIENMGNIEAEEEDICTWSNEEELTLREGERLLAEWRC